MREIYSLKKQAEITDQILVERLNTILKDTMEETGIDTWLLVSKEYCEDPMFKLLTPCSFLTARRITILILHNNGETLEKYCCNGSYEDLETIYTNVWTDKSKDQYKALDDFLHTLDIKKIGLDFSNSYAYFDGLSKSLYDTFKEKLSADICDKFVSAEQLGILYTEKRSALELPFLFLPVLHQYRLCILN